MNWFAWQQHKKQFLTFGVLLVLFMALVIPTGLSMWHSYQHSLSTCDTTDTCSAIADTLFRTGWQSRMLMLMKAVVICVPFVLALFIGAPLIAREYTEGTNLLVWTQGVSRRTWLGVKLAWALGATIIVAGAYAVLSTWWWRTGNALYLDRFHPLNFGIQGIVPVAIAVWAVSMGIAYGAWCKRLLPAMALTLGTLIAVQVIVPTMVRPHYASPSTYTTAIDLNGSPRDQLFAIPHAGAVWAISSNLINAKGEVLDWNNPPAACSYTREQIEAERTKLQETNQRPKGGYFSRDGGPVISTKCLADRGYTWHISYQPANRYWKFQGIEAGLYLLLSCLSLAAAYFFVNKRDA